jgi:hypothetical protein|tara:strand:+ start:5318 stop:5536 length:219 start_codon:yes stop_codon:yes gene_type:complete
MKPAEELLKNMLDDNMEKFQQTFGDTFKLKVQDVTGQITPDIVANLVTKTEPEVEEPEVEADNESEDTDEAI